MARLKWVQIEMDVDRLTKPFYGYWGARDVRRALADKFDRYELLHMALLCVQRLEEIHETESEKYKEREVVATFDQSKSASWAKSCGTRKGNARVLSDKYKEIVKILKSLERN
jgi:hypothetical protein